MTMTEADALDKFCPHRLYEDMQGPCWGSKCMAWRWYDTIRMVSSGTSGSVGRGTTCLPTSPLFEKLPKYDWTGYCGLGGKP